MNANQEIKTTKIKKVIELILSCMHKWIAGTKSANE